MHTYFTDLLIRWLQYIPFSAIAYILDYSPLNYFICIVDLLLITIDSNCCYYYMIHYHHHLLLLLLLLPLLISIVFDKDDWK